MSQKSLGETIYDSTIELLELAKTLTYNDISGNCEYIISEIVNFNDKKPGDLIKQKINENELKTPKKISAIILDLEKLYSNIYDINLYIYKSLPNKTIIDIRYYLKSSLDKSFFQTVKDNDPMFHVKVNLPSFHSSNNKFNINWEYDKYCN